MIKTYRISNMDAIINSVKGPSTNEAPKAAAPKAAPEVKEEIQEEIQLEEKEEIKTEPEPEKEVEQVEKAPVVKKTTRKKSTASE